ncbi:MAG: hypothetical protein R2762_15535 [Bryobacteraceae bacterium]
MPELFEITWTDTPAATAGVAAVWRRSYCQPDLLQFGGAQDAPEIRALRAVPKRRSVQGAEDQTRFPGILRGRDLTSAQFFQRFDHEALELDNTAVAFAWCRRTLDRQAQKETERETLPPLCQSMSDHQCQIFTRTHARGESQRAKARTIWIRAPLPGSAWTLPH